jgi:hypothetical protein
LLLRELRDFILTLSKSQRVPIAVDDVDRIDEPSAALLAALADKMAWERTVVSSSTANNSMLME